MRLNFMPDDLVARREAEGYLRGIMGLLALIVGASFAIVVPIIPHDRALHLLVALPVWALIIAGYLNARRSYRYVSSSNVILISIPPMLLSATVFMHLYGSTSNPLAGIYVVTIVFCVVFLSPAAGMLALLTSIASFWGMIIAEQLDWLSYAPLAPIKAPLKDAKWLTRNAAAIVPIINGGTYVMAYFVARSQRARRMEVDHARSQAEMEKKRAESMSRELADKNEQLIAMDETKNRFLGIVSHDLRTPITSIKAYGEILEEEVAEEHKQFSRVIVDEADRLHRLVTDLLDLDKMEVGKMEWELSPQDIRPVLENAARVFGGAAQDKDIAVTSKMADDLPNVNIDADRIAQLVANLLSNAIKFTPEGGTVTLRAFLETRGLSPLPDQTLEGVGNSMHIAVADTGPGIAPEDLDKIFERFSQTETGKKEGAGTGLGLAIAKEIAAGHGGEITVTSVLGEGTTFTVALPLP